MAMVKESTRNDEVPITSNKEKPLPPLGLQRPCQSGENREELHMNALALEESSQ